MTEAEEWRSQVWELVSGLSEPVQVLVVLCAFSLGLFSVRAID